MDFKNELVVNDLDLSAASPSIISVTPADDSFLYDEIADSNYENDEILLHHDISSEPKKGNTINTLLC